MHLGCTLFQIEQVVTDEAILGSGFYSPNDCLAVTPRFRKVK